MICKNCNFKLKNDSSVCPICGISITQEENRTSLPEGSELLNGLNLVQNYLQKTSDKLDEFWNLERYYRQEKYIKKQKNIETKTIAEKSQYGLFIAGMAFSIVFGVITLLSGNIQGLFFCLVITAIFAVGKAKENKSLFRLAGFLLLLLLITWASGLIDIIQRGRLASNTFYIGVNIAAFALASFAGLIMLKKYNKKIDSYNENARAIENAYNEEVRKENELIDQKRYNLSLEITALTDEMQDKTSSWYPIDYYALECVEKFIKIVRNHEADTVKEMLKVYKEDAYRSEVLNNQLEMQNQMNQSLMNQEQMIKLQKISNLIKMGNLAANLVTASNTANISKTLESINVNTMRSAEAANRAANSAQHIADKLR